MAANSEEGCQIPSYVVRGVHPNHPIFDPTNTMSFEATKGQGSDLPIVHTQFTTNAFFFSLFVMIAFEVITETLSSCHLVAHHRCPDLP